MTWKDENDGGFTYEGQPSDFICIRCGESLYRSRFGWVAKMAVVFEHTGGYAGMKDTYRCGDDIEPHKAVYKAAA